ncbi:glutathione S-transferase N-terminal domain-containing protein [Bowmanella sp. Y26]|uniref:glutathione S-transferase N-terminal domain-containing protein n=1 Tax=Bowmanella yangjiangensis TaxID=2811230 RepID=UPI001BDC3A8B|nr:glutathione S-transferase N-terminal domain-containing protein [Bowmanella yangjiangensis]MBT1064371.1 glutathione S-transferase N-terminal domain-containing protein [Bowmanella yangjiangensis]
MNQLIWVIDSPYSRATKWLLTAHNIAHQDHILSWQTLKSDTLLKRHNPKQQVPTFLLGDDVCGDSLLIAMRLLPFQWHQTDDAYIFRLADSDFEAAILFFFRAKLLAEKFGPSDNSALMFAAGKETYTKAVDILFDHLMPDETAWRLNFGVVMAFSTILACRMLSMSAEIANYRLDDLRRLSTWIGADAHYQYLADNYSTSAETELPFFIL